MKSTDSSSFHLYKSSAGSGKTYTLALHFIAYALTHPRTFRAVLAVTFTNKATEEMKSRILLLLQRIVSDKDDDLLTQLSERVGWEKEKIKLNATSLLSEILHQYSWFSVRTLDTFFNQVIKVFHREAGLSGSYSVELNSKKVLEEVASSLLEHAGQPDSKELRSWLQLYAEKRLFDGKTWDYSSEIKSLSYALLEDNVQKKLPEILAFSERKSAYNDILRGIVDAVEKIEEEFKKVGEEGYRLFLDNGYDLEEFKGKSRGLSRFIKKWENGDLELPETINYSQAEEWLSKADLTNMSKCHFVENKLVPFFTHSVLELEILLINYNSYKTVLEYFFAYALLAELTLHLKKYREENEVLLISDLGELVKQLVSTSETPFVYEKLGNRFHHYLLDEVQDTSVTQWSNFKPLISNAISMGSECMAVGDVKQSIYRWRGGDWRLLHYQMEQDVYPQPTNNHWLDTNYRSDQAIVKNIGYFFEQLASFKLTNHDGFEPKAKVLWDSAISAYKSAKQICKSQKEGYVLIEILQVEKEKDFFEWSLSRLVKEIVKCKAAGNSWSDMAILTRNAREGRKIIEFMTDSNHFLDHNLTSIPIISQESLYLGTTHVVRFIIALCKASIFKDNPIYQAEVNFFLETITGNTDFNPSFSGIKNKTIENAIIQELKTLPIVPAVERIICLYQLDKYPKYIAALTSFLDIALIFQKQNSGGLDDFIIWWDENKWDFTMMMPESTDAIRLLTIHKSKGLEFPIVFIPFANWSLDHSPLHENLLWVQTEKASLPISTLPVVPVRYKSSLKKTVWKEEYEIEQIQTAIDAINLLYVAMTRPQNTLIVFSESVEAAKHIGYLLTNYFDGWQNRDDTLVFECGTIQRNVNHKNTKSSQTSIREFRINKSDVFFSQKFANVQLESEKQYIGLQIHEELSKIFTIDDLALLKDSKNYWVIDRMINHPNLSPYFSTKVTVWTEQSILLEDGTSRVLDRLVKLEDGTYVVIEFKTGAKKDGHMNQIKEYILLLKQMDLPVQQSIIVYLDPLDIISLPI